MQMRVGNHCLSLTTVTHTQNQQWQIFASHCLLFYACKGANIGIHRGSKFTSWPAKSQTTTNLHTKTKALRYGHTYMQANDNRQVKPRCKFPCQKMLTFLPLAFCGEYVCHCWCHACGSVPLHDALLPGCTAAFIEDEREAQKWRNLWTRTLTVWPRVSRGGLKLTLITDRTLVEMASSFSHAKQLKHKISPSSTHWNHFIHPRFALHIALILCSV